MTWKAVARRACVSLEGNLGSRRSALAMAALLKKSGYSTVEIVSAAGERYEPDEFKRISSWWRSL